MKKVTLFKDDFRILKKNRCGDTERPWSRCYNFAPEGRE